MRKEISVRIITITNMIHAMAEDMPTLYSENAELYTISEISAIYKMIYNGGLNVSDACRQVKELFDASDHRDKILQFIENSKRGIVR